MGKLYHFLPDGSVRRKAKPVCIHRGKQYYSPLDGRTIYRCGCHAAKSFPGCIEDWRRTKIVCPEYKSEAVTTSTDGTL